MGRQSRLRKARKALRGNVARGALTPEDAGQIYRAVKGRTADLSRLEPPGSPKR